MNPLGGTGGQHYKPSVVWGGGGVDFKIQIGWGWVGGGEGRRRNDRFTKKIAPPHPPPPPKLINNDVPLRWLTLTARMRRLICAKGYFFSSVLKNTDA